MIYLERFFPFVKRIRRKYISIVVFYIRLWKDLLRFFLSSFSPPSFLFGYILVVTRHVMLRSGDTHTHIDGGIGHRVRIESNVTRRNWEKIRERENQPPSSRNPFMGKVSFVPANSWMETFLAGWRRAGENRGERKKNLFKTILSFLSFNTMETFTLRRVAKRNLMPFRWISFGTIVLISWQTHVT